MASQARRAEEEMPTRRATSLMRSVREGLREADASNEFFLLDTGSGFL
jgi:hypothetical protein